MIPYSTHITGFDDGGTVIAGDCESTAIGKTVKLVMSKVCASIHA